MACTYNDVYPPTLHSESTSQVNGSKFTFFSMTDWNPPFNTGFPSQWGPNAKLRSTKLSTFSNGVITLWPHRGFWSLSGSPVNRHKGSSAPPPHLRLTSNPPRIVSYRQTLTTVYLQSPMFVWQLHTKFSAQSLKLDLKYSNLISFLLNF